MVFPCQGSILSFGLLLGVGFAGFAVRDDDIVDFGPERTSVQIASNGSSQPKADLGLRHAVLDAASARLASQSINCGRSSWHGLAMDGGTDDGRPRIPHAGSGNGCLYRTLSAMWPQKS